MTVQTQWLREQGRGWQGLGSKRLRRGHGRTGFPAWGRSQRERPWGGLQLTRVGRWQGLIGSTTRRRTPGKTGRGGGWRRSERGCLPWGVQLFPRGGTGGRWREEGKWRWCLPWVEQKWILSKSQKKCFFCKFHHISAMNQSFLGFYSQKDSMNLSKFHCCPDSSRLTVLLFIAYFIGGWQAQRPCLLKLCDSKTASAPLP